MSYVLCPMSYVLCVMCYGRNVSLDVFPSIKKNPMNSCCRASNFVLVPFKLMSLTCHSSFQDDLIHIHLEKQERLPFRVYKRCKIYEKRWKKKGVKIPWLVGKIIFKRLGWMICLCVYVLMCIEKG